MKILVITHTFPPSKHSNAKRPQYLVRALLDAGWQVDVATSSIGVETEEEEVLQHPQLVVRRYSEPVWWLQKTLQKHGLGGFSKVVSMASNGLLFPDFCALWARKVFRAFRKNGEKYDRVLAFVFPPSVLLSGSYKIVDERWTFDFQESVTPQFERYPRKSFMQRWMLGRLKKLERKTLHEAGQVVFTAESNRAAYIERGIVPESRTWHMPYFYDDQVFSGVIEHRDQFEIGYYGNFDLTGARSPEIFLKSLAGFLDRVPAAREETSFVFYGSWLERHDVLIDGLGLREVCKIHAAVPYEQYLKRLQTSPILLLIVAEEHNLFMPSKIVDYFGARRPILAFVPEASEMDEILETAGMGAYRCQSGQVEEGVDALMRLWNKHQNGGLSVDDEKISRWSSGALLPKYLKILKNKPAKKRKLK